MTTELSAIGGLFITLYGALLALLSGYQNYSFEKSIFKQLYNEVEKKKQEEISNPLKGDFRELMRQQTKNGNDFSQSYGVMLLASLL